MKRYRIFSFDFDTRAHSLDPVQDQWDEKVKELHVKNREQTIKGLAIELGKLMPKIRAATIKKIENILDSSYFTKDSFNLKNLEDEEPFLIITFIPVEEYFFEIRESDYDDDFAYETLEASGIHMLEAGGFNKSSFSKALMAITPWVKRIKEELDISGTPDEVDEYINTLRASFEKHTNDEGKFSKPEIDELSKKIDKLESIIIKQAEKLEASAQEIKKFKKEFENIKNDLTLYDKGVWYRVAGNKVVKTTKTFLTSPEGRKLLVDGFKKLLE
ncbi:MAG: hypothetical protein QM479_02765 [Pseudomonadota bacterium]